MRFSDLKVYLKFLSRNKLYTFVTIFGFSISLMFILLLSIYVKQEFSIDDFHKNKDRIFLMANSPGNASFANPVADLIMDNIPEVECFTRIVSRPLVINNGQEKMTMKAMYADSAFFKMFSFELLEGDPSKVLALKKNAVIAKSFANKIYPDENPIGKFLQINDSLALTITGVMEDFPRNTHLPQSDVIINYQMIESNWGRDILTNWGNSSFTHYYMAKEGTNLPSKTQTILDLFLKNEYWLYKDGFASEVIFIPLKDIYFNEARAYFSDIRHSSKTQVSVYLIITILILIVAILNYINLSVSQAGKRGKESAIKKLLGSDKKVLIIQFISESVLMTFISFVLGIFLTFVAESFFNDALNTQLNLKGQFDFSFICMVVLGIIVIGVVAGLVPAIIISRFKPIEVVKGTYILKVKSVYSKVLISFQYIVAISLLICSFFIIKQTVFMKNYDLGFSKDNIFIMDNKLTPDRLQGLRSLLEGVSGVEKVSFSVGTPVDGGNNQSFEYNGQSLSFQSFVVDTAFFSIFGIKIEPTGVVPSKKTYWLNRKAYDLLEPDSVSYSVPLFEDGGVQIAGIVNDFHIRSLHSEIGPLMIRPLEGSGWWPWSIIVKINSNTPLKTADEVKEAYSQYMNGELFDSKFVDATIQGWYQSEDRIVMILSAFTVLTIIILLMGIFAMSQYYVVQKKKEIGIRKVNGATELEIIKMLNMNFLKWIVLAFIISVPLVYYVMNRWLESFSFKISLSWWVFVAAGGVVFILSMIFITIQTWKAAIANPIESIKAE